MPTSELVYVPMVIGLTAERVRCSLSRIQVIIIMALICAFLFLLNQSDGIFNHRNSMKSLKLKASTLPSQIPQQIHLALGHNENTMVVSWLTFDPTCSSVVNYGIHSMNLMSYGSQSMFLDGEQLDRIVYTHRAELTIEPGEFYIYRVGAGADDSWSLTFKFVAPRSVSEKWSPTIAVYGDMGLENARAMPALTELVQQGKLDAILHAGDIAYSLETNNGQVGDNFMKMIEPLATRVPYMTCPGNHDTHNNYTYYLNRFAMPSDTKDSLFYSFNLGPIHFVMLNTVLYHAGPESSAFAQTQWVVNDLKMANEPSNRALRPWIVIVGHHPMYCTKFRKDCRSYQLKNALEDIFMKFGVDIQISGHLHSYERLWPTYNFMARNGTTVPGKPYYNPNAPLHLTSGAAGSLIIAHSFGKTDPSYSAFETANYGFSMLKFYNASHAHVVYYSVDKNETIDDIWVVKTSPYPPYYQQSNWE